MLAYFTRATLTTMLIKVFIPQDVLDSWVTADKVELSGEIMTFRGQNLSLRVVPGYYFDHVLGGSDEGHQLVGKVKAKAAIAALGAEVYINSVILGDTAYEVEAGVVAKPLETSSTRQAVLSALTRCGL
jgi:hypothetical protein